MMPPLSISQSALPTPAKGDATRNGSNARTAASSRGVHSGACRVEGVGRAWLRSRRTGSVPPAGWPPGQAGPLGAAGQPGATAELPAAPPRRPRTWRRRRRDTARPFLACTAGHSCAARGACEPQGVLVRHAVLRLSALDMPGRPPASYTGSGDGGPIPVTIN